MSNQNVKEHELTPEERTKLLFIIMEILAVMNPKSDALKDTDMFINCMWTLHYLTQDSDDQFIE